MGKTYEAYLKSTRSIDAHIVLPDQLDDWQCPDLTDTAAIAELAQRVTIEASKNKFQIFNFVSSRSGEGTSTIIVNLAKLLAKAEAHKNIVLIDANYQHSVLHLALNTPIGVGLSDFFTQQAKTTDIVHKATDGNIQVIPRGKSPGFNPAKLEPETFQNLLSDLKHDHGYILIDSSPLLSSFGSLLFSTSADTNFFVVQAFQTHREVLEKAKKILAEYDCRISGVVLNKTMRVVPEWLYNRL